MKKYSPITIFGLGRMGAQIAHRLHKKGFAVHAWNRSPEPVKEILKYGERRMKQGDGGGKLLASNDLGEVISWTGTNKINSSPLGKAVSSTSKNEEENSEAKRTCRIFWIMLPHAIVDDFLFGKSHLGPHLRKGDIVIDGGNSFYKLSMARAKKMAKKGVYYFDCGTSGGVWGEKNGFALMVGGPKEKWSMIEPYIAALSAGDNYAYCGASGAGHFVKMVHNGIEYGMMEAIGEGYAVMHASKFKLNLGDVTRVYQKGSVVRSWLIDLYKNIFDNEDIANTSGKIESNGEGEWTVKTGKELGVDVRVIEDALRVRNESVDPKNQKKYSNKIVALMRKQFGGHAVHRK